MASCSKSPHVEQTVEHANNTRPKLSKEEKKLIKKQVKASNILMRHEGIQTVSHPSKSLVVANGGLGNGVSRQQLLNVLQRCGLVDSLLMPPNKPYSFVTYSSTEEAIQACASLSGQDLPSADSEQKITLYFSFVEKVEVREILPPPLPPGLVIVEDFVSPDEELVMLENILWEVDNSNQKSLKHRRVKHYGYEFRYDNNNVDKDQPLPGGLPEFCNSVLDRCLLQGLIKNRPDQLTINQYEPGQGIPPHIDTHSAFEDEIISLSLGAEIVMDFKPPSGSSVPVMLPRRSLLVMSGESRHLWTHGITPRKFDVVQMTEGQKFGTVSRNSEELTLNKRGTRTSFTFRKIRRGLCKCAFPSVCDSQQKDSSPPPVGDLGAESLEKEYVHKVYEDIAGHFSSTRHTPWPKITDFLMGLPIGSLVADVGCGNGKYLGVNKELYMERRLAAILEITRLLKTGGRALIYVWAMEQEYKKQKSKYLKGSKSSTKQASLTDVPVTPDSTDSLPIHTNRTAFDSQDLLVPWHLKAKSQAGKSDASTTSEEEQQLASRSVYHRYYHVFCEGELEALCGKLSDVTVQSAYHDQGNWCVVLGKF
ncbi:alkylated DNA repair protein alkB homolog 8 isoform X3 [Pseudophryne corroboree]|uniref:alkylated DNA repair protein alkB homolog 8 isoform X3 n=1 Tax=Pseudophryne corroboree TaxID=495146 RepID=UPI0030816067